MTAAEPSAPWATGHDGVVRTLRLRGRTPPAPPVAKPEPAPERGATDGVDAHARTRIVGREAELAAVEQCLASAAQRPTRMVVSGEPGIGKTVLWEEAVADARARGYRVLANRSVRAESELAFAGLHDLLAGVLQDVADGLAPPRRRALEVALLLAEPDGAPPHARAIGLACLDVVRELARDAPLIVALDDIQWLDVSSANVLSVALRRLGDEHVGVVATRRDEPGARAPTALEHHFEASSARRLALGPLERAALHRLLRERLALDLSRPTLERIEEASAGNPLFALEIASAAVCIEPGRPVAVPDSLRGLLGGRLDRLPAPALDVLLDVAASARPTTELMSAARGGCDEVLDALHVARRGGVVVLEGSDVRFAHPLLASLCYEQALPSRRRAAHRRLAAAVADPEERARHLALAADGPDRAVAAELDAAAGHAAARGATAAAADLARLAVDQTPPHLRDEHRRRRLETARLYRFAGDFASAGAVYQELLDELPSGPPRARALYAIASIATVGLPERIRLGEQALAEADGDDACAAEILGFLGHCRWLRGELAVAVRDSRAAVALAEAAGDARVLSGALARAACVETFALDFTPGLLERALARERTLDQPVAWHENPTLMLTVAVMHRRDDLDAARELLDHVEAAAIDRGDEDTRPWTVMQRIVLEWYAGNWPRALEHAADARELAEQLGHPQYRLMVARFTAPVQAGLGLVEEARASAAEGVRLAESISDERMLIGTLAALGQLELALGDLEAAAGYLTDLPARLLRTGHRNPVNGPWADAIETLAGLGEMEQARAQVATYREVARRANRWARIGAERCAGIVAAAEGDTHGAAAAFARASRLADSAPYPFERGRTLLAEGVARRHARQSRAARDSLERALAVFEGLGATLWAAKARKELELVSGRRPVSGLTAAERRVASLAAAGRRNKEIATELFLSVRTVEAYLSRAYAKLGVRSRTELARRFGADGADGEEAAANV